MPFWRTYYHLVWATKRRTPLIVPAIEPVLFRCLMGEARKSGWPVYAANGWVDHVHMVLSIPPSVAVSAAVKQLKGASAYHLNQLGGQEYHFAWQRGYSVFTLGERQRASAVAYVQEQKAHHACGTTNEWLEPR